MQILFKSDNRSYSIKEEMLVGGVVLSVFLF